MNIKDEAGEVIKNVSNAAYKVFSNDMADCCTHRCRVCGRETTLTSMRAHTKTHHGMNIKEYTDMYGDYRTQMAREVYHKCGLCGEELLLDGDELHKHCNRHRIRMKEYTAEFVVLLGQTGRKSLVEDDLQDTVIKKETGDDRSVWKTPDIESLVESIYA